MGEDAWYFGGDELMLVSTEDEIYGYDEMMSVYRNSLGSRLVDLRERRNLKQKDVAAFLQISSQAYSQYEHDRRSPDLITAARLAKFFDVSLEYLATGEAAKEEAIGRYLNEDLSVLPPEGIHELLLFYDYLQYKYQCQPPFE